MRGPGRREPRRGGAAAAAARARPWGASGRLELRGRGCRAEGLPSVAVGSRQSLRGSRLSVASAILSGKRAGSSSGGARSACCVGDLRSAAAM